MAAIDLGQHCRSLHVGKSVGELRERLAAEHLKQASSFYDEEVAIWAVSEAIDQAQREVEAWCNSEDPFPLSICVSLRVNIGEVVRKVGTPEESTTVRVILDKQRSGVDFRVVTAFPI